MPKITGHCPTCGKEVWGDAIYCRKHYYDKLKENRKEMARIKMVVSEWEAMPDGVLRRTATNAA